MTGKARRIFGDLPMGWPVVVVLALVAGAYTGLMGSLPVTEGTSFRDIAITHEWWIVFAFAIATNVDKGWQAALKIFVFFLISQPVCFAVEVLMGQLSAEMAWYYYSTNWFKMTLLTLPGGYIAHLIRRQDPLGCVVLGLGCAFEAVLGIHYMGQVIARPPFHLLSFLVCFGAIAVFVAQIQRSRRRRILTLAVAVVAVAAVVGWVLATGSTL